MCAQPYALSSEATDYLTLVGEHNVCLEAASPRSPLPAARRLVRCDALARLAADYGKSTVHGVVLQTRGLVHMHSFVKHTVPSKCRHCKRACYLQAMSCTKCGVICHRKCTELLQVSNIVVSYAVLHWHAVHTMQLPLTPYRWRARLRRTPC